MNWNECLNFLRDNARNYGKIIQQLYNTWPHKEMVLAWGLSKSMFLDMEYYLRVYPDVQMSEVDPYLHYARHGYKELRSPQPQISAQIIAQIARQIPELTFCTFERYMDILQHLADLPNHENFISGDK